MTVAVCLILGGIINLYAELRQHVGLLAFGNRIAEKQIGGTYITTLNAFSNLGAMWPRTLWTFIADSGRFLLMAVVGWVYSGIFIFYNKDIIPRMEKKSPA
jgi:hypothetical protein